MTCPRCLADQRPENYLNPRKCAFDDNGIFQDDNWACATMFALRQLARAHVDTWLDEGIVVVRIPEFLDFYGFLVMTSYKHRGKTATAQICNSYEVCALTLELAEGILCNQ